MRRIGTKRQLSQAAGLVATFLLPLFTLMSATQAVAFESSESTTSPSKVSASSVPATLEFTPASGTVTPSAGSTVGGEPVVIRLEDAPQVISSAHSHGFGVALTSDGDVLTWGAGTSGQLGNGELFDSLTPVLLAAEAFGGEQIARVAAGDGSAYAFSASGVLYGWGAVTHAPTPTPLAVPDLDGEIVKVVAAGEWAYLLTDAGSLFGIRTGANQEAAEQVTLIRDEDVTDIAASTTNVIVTTSQEGVWVADVATLATEGFAPLIDPDSPQSEPSLLALPLNQVAAGGGWFAGIAGDGQVVAWVG